MNFLRRMFQPTGVTNVERLRRNIEHLNGVQSLPHEVQTVNPAGIPGLEKIHEELYARSVSSTRPLNTRGLLGSLHHARPRTAKHACSPSKVHRPRPATGLHQVLSGPPRIRMSLRRNRFTSAKPMRFNVSAKTWRRRWLEHREALQSGCGRKNQQSKDKRLEGSAGTQDMAQYTYIYREIAGYKGFLKDSERKGTAAEISGAVIKTFKENC